MKEVPRMDGWRGLGRGGQACSSSWIPLKAASDRQSLGLRLQCGAHQMMDLLQLHGQGPLRSSVLYTG